VATSTPTEEYSNWSKNLHCTNLMATHPLRVSLCRTKRTVRQMELHEGHDETSFIRGCVNSRASYTMNDGHSME